MRRLRAAIYPASRLYYRSVLPSVKSVLKHSPVDSVILTIEDDRAGYIAQIGEQIPDCIQTVNASEVAWNWLNHRGPNVRNQYVYLCLLRCAYAELFAKYDRVLSLDADAFMVRDADPWAVDLEGCHIGGAAEIKISAERRRAYISAGAMIMDLKRIRNDGLSGQLIDAINNKWFQWVEQDCLNDYCQTKALGSEWNSSTFTGIAEEPIIRHFAFWEQANWKNSDIFRRYDAMSWEEVLK